MQDEFALARVRHEKGLGGGPQARSADEDVGEPQCFGPARPNPG